METADLCIFLSSYALTAAFVSVAQFLRHRDATWLITVTVALLSVIATTVVGFYVDPGTSYGNLISKFFQQRDFSAAVSMGMGVAVALVWVGQLTAPSNANEDSQGLRRRCAHQIVLSISIAGVVVGGQSFIWTKLLGFAHDPPARALVPGFVIEKIASVDYPPVRVAAGDDGTIYVCYDYFEDWGDIGGTIVQLWPHAATGMFQQRIVADSPLLMRPYGLAARDGNLYVSRSGIHPQASQGTISYESTGAVTLLSDLDNDGYFEYMDDIVSGLPGARGPDPQKQNNGIAFAEDGGLFVTSGCAANRALDKHPWGGVVLRVSPDFKHTEVFARGFRNPFGIVIGPDNEVFVTDNDVHENPGDELNHVVRGAHYGHPYIVPNETAVEASGFCEPILLGGPESNLLGMAYATSAALPEEFRNCLYVTDYTGGQILRLTLARDGSTFQVTGVYPFARLVAPLDIAVTPLGEFIVISHRTQNVYRIRLMNPHRTHREPAGDG